jgi:DNA-binding XRE family transcriptional regulator
MKPSARKTPQAKLKIDLRERRGAKSKRQVSHDIGITMPTLAHIEAGCGVHLDVALKLARYYDLRVDDIWELRGK